MLRHASENLPGSNEEDDTTYIKFLKEHHINNSVLYDLVIISLILTILVVAVCSSIAIFSNEANVLFNEAKNCLKKIPNLLTVIFATSIVLIGYLWFWIYVVICMITTPEIQPLNRRLEKDTALSRFYDNKYRAQAI
ncbi:choline transporter-like 1 [Episyrphus balteatus]|uniref:choline transporter-like 1 n=1 Tax=Episyrphus balteatus TaxID=286459 RepID=UPI00248664F4|nr:choline transporter-like 1 [Episyrphus balteatus]